MKFEFTEQQLMVIHKCLMLGQFGEVHPVVNEINRQIVAQQTAAAVENDSATLGE